MNHRVGVPAALALALALATGVVVATPASAAMLRLTAPNVPGEKSPSAWLREAEALELRGELALAGDAYGEALAALSARARRGNEGAKVATFAAEAYWQAFELDADPAHLRAGIEVLGRWLEATGPQSEAPLLGDVQAMVERLREIHDPLVAGDAALAATDAVKAAEHYSKALDALAYDPQQWDTGARLTLRLADGLVRGYDASVTLPADIEPHLHELRLARDVLERWLALPTPDGAARRAELEPRLAEIRARIGDAEHALAEAAGPEPEPEPEPEQPEPLPKRQVVRKGTGLVIAASVVGGGAWVAAATHAGLCAGQSFNCGDGRGPFIAGIVLNTSGYVLGPLAGWRRGRYDGVAAAWDGTSQRKPEISTGLGAGLLIAGLAGWIGARFGTGTIPAVAQPFLSQLSSSTIATGGALLMYGVLYRKTRDTEDRRAQAAGHKGVRPLPPRSKHTGLALLLGGAVGTGTGGPLIAKGIALAAAVRRQARKAQTFESQYAGAYDLAGFDADLRTSRRGTTSMIVGGTVLTAGGIVTSSVGIAMLAHDRRVRKRQRQDARARLSTYFTPTLMLLSVSGRF